MGGFLAEMLAFPTVIFTVLLALALLYWTVVLLGLLEIEVRRARRRAGDRGPDPLHDAATRVPGSPAT